MRWDRAVELLKTVDTSRMPLRIIEIRLRFWQDKDNPTTPRELSGVIVKYEAADRDTGTLTHIDCASKMHPTNDEEFFRSLFLSIMVAVRHEAEETFLVDGKRLYDPHLDALSR